MPALDRYRAKRDPAGTPEPVPSRAPRRRRPGGRPTFVVQEHHARNLHWDLRLERDGVLVSWAVPKGVPLHPGADHLAVHVEDHPLEYGSFEGTIPAGEYGAGRVTIWDRGSYDCDKWTEDEVAVTLHGTRATGRYVLFRTRGEDWMLHRVDPAPQGWEPLPRLVAPMLATAGPLPTSGGWAYEFKWDGVRAVTYVEGGRVRVLTRNGTDASGSFPELRGLGRALGAIPAVLDGEVVALDTAGRPSFASLQHRLHAGGRSRPRSGRGAVTYMVFDVLHLQGRSTVDLPYLDRRSLLAELELEGERWATSPFYVGGGAKVLGAAAAAGLEGVVAKRCDSRYEPGTRSRSWVKVKLEDTREVVVGGWIAGTGVRRASVGSLLVGVPAAGGLHYLGKVGSGFDAGTLAELRALLEGLATDRSPFAGGVPKAAASGAHWVEPRLVAEVRHAGLTAHGRLRQAVWHRLRPDKSPAEVDVEP